MNADPLALLQRIRVVPLIVIDDAKNAAPLAKALSMGGLPCAEIAFRTPAAGEALRRLRAAGAEILAGAGTILTPQQAAEARDAGAQFVVSPGFNPRVVDYCVACGGSWKAPRDWIAAGEFDRIRGEVEQTVWAVKKITEN